MGTCHTKARSTENSDELHWHPPFVIISKKKHLGLLAKLQPPSLLSSPSIAWMPDLTVGSGDLPLSALTLEGKNMLMFIQQNPVLSDCSGNYEYFNNQASVLSSSCRHPITSKFFSYWYIWGIGHVHASCCPNIFMEMSISHPATLVMIPGSISGRVALGHPFFCRQWLHYLAHWPRKTGWLHNRFTCWTGRFWTHQLNQFGK